MAWVEPQQWYAQLASFYAASAALITDSCGKVLLVKPNYRDHWVIPGGYVDQHETPHDALSRELAEELGQHLRIGPLLVIDWAAAAGPRPRPIISFLFDGGRLDPAAIKVNPEELDTFGFFEPDRCKELLPPAIAPRIDAALEAQAKGTTVYLTDGALPRRSP